MDRRVARVETQIVHEEDLTRFDSHTTATDNRSHADIRAEHLEIATTPNSRQQIHIRSGELLDISHIRTQGI